jgi:hypothetical protein
VALTDDTSLFSGADPRDPYAGMSTKVKVVIGV